MLAKSRIDKLTGLKLKDMNSMGTSRKASDTLVLPGKKSLKIFSLWVFKHIMFIPTNKNRLKEKVTIK